MGLRLGHVLPHLSPLLSSMVLGVSLVEEGFAAGVVTSSVVLLCCIRLFMFWN